MIADLDQQAHSLRDEMDNYSVLFTSKEHDAIKALIKSMDWLRHRISKNEDKRVALR